MSARLRFNPDKTIVEIETPEGETVSVNIDDDEDVPIFVVNEDNPDDPAYVAIAAKYKGLRANTVYKLVPVQTIVELNAELEEDEEEEDEEDGGVLVNG